MKRLILLWLICFFSSDCTIPRAVILSKQIIKSKNPVRHQQELALYLQDATTSQFNQQEDLQHICNALALFSTPLTPFITSLKQSLSRFMHTPGYIENLRLLVVKHHCRELVNGHGYEIERALTLARNNEPVLGFNVTLATKKLSREFDILTRNYAVECKNIRWKNKINEKLQTQFLTQKKIINHQNRLYKYNRRFQVSSKQSVPEYWQDWFKKHDIDLHEEQYSFSLL